MKKTAFLYIILAGIGWGTSGIFLKNLVSYGFTPMQTTTVRAVVAAIAFALYVLLTDRKSFKIIPKELLLFALGGAAIYGTAAFYFSAIEASSASTAVVLMYTAPVIVMVFSVLFLGEKFSVSKLVSVVLVTVGCALVSGIIGGLKFSVFGIVLGLLAGIAYSSYNLITRIQMMRGMSSTSSTLYGFIFMAVLSLVLTNPAETLEIALNSSPKALLWILGIGVVTCVLPYLFYTLALKYIPAGTASTMAVIEPVAATLFSVVIFGEKLDLTSIIGIMMILSAVILLSKSEK